MNVCAASLPSSAANSLPIASVFLPIAAFAAWARSGSLRIRPRIMSAASMVCWPSSAWNCSANSPGVTGPPAGSAPARPPSVSPPLEPDGSGAASTAARLVGAAAVLPPDPATQPATSAMATTDAPSRSSRDEPAAGPARFPHCKNPHAAQLDPSMGKS